MSIVMLIQSMGKGLNGQVGYASAISLVLFLLTLIPLAVVGIVNNGDAVREALDNRRARRARRAQKNASRQEVSA
jgi:hypothetical protein